MSVWSTLDMRRRIIVIGATFAMFAAVLGLSRMASQPTMSLLYSGLDPAAAGEVVAALEQQAVNYDVRAGAIFVEAARRDALRLTLAAEGLPASNGQGYEILDSLTGFGTTSQMFDAAYWRAKEGELARTIVANPQIQGARVHISSPSSNPFQRDVKATASVTVMANAGGIGATQAKALKYLVASAVSGLSPDDVSVIDGRGGLIMSGDDPQLNAGGGDDRAAEMRHNIQRILEARVGPGNAVVEVSVETVTEREAIVERRFDPENRVAISSDTEERSNTSSGTQGGAVTVASNLPDGDAAGGENNSRSENSESRERINYEVSETTREILRNPGAIKKISVAVLVDGIRNVDAATGEETWQARTDEEMESLRELISSTVGIDTNRGDTLTLKTLEFEPMVSDVMTNGPSLFEALNLDTMSILQLAVLAIVALTLGIFVVRPILSSAQPQTATALALPGQQLEPDAIPANSASRTLPAGASALGSGQLANSNASTATADQIALTGEIDNDSDPLPDLAVISPDNVLNPTFALDAGSGQADPVERLRSLIEERKEETVEILRSWMEEKEEPVQ